MFVYLDALNYFYCKMIMKKWFLLLIWNLWSGGNKPNYPQSTGEGRNETGHKRNREKRGLQGTNKLQLHQREHLLLLAAGKEQSLILINLVSHQMKQTWTSCELSPVLKYFVHQTQQALVLPEGCPLDGIAQFICLLAGTTLKKEKIWEIQWWFL